MYPFRGWVDSNFLYLTPKPMTRGLHSVSNLRLKSVKKNLVVRSLLMLSWVSERLYSKCYKYYDRF